MILDRRVSKKADSDSDASGTTAPEMTPLKYFHIDEFEDESAGEIFLAVMPPAPNATSQRRPRDVPAYLAHLWQIPVLTPDQEYHCFRKLNYLKYLASKSICSVVHDRRYHEMFDDSEALQDSIHRVRNFLVESNLRLVVSIAKRHAVPNTDQFEELVCVGNAAVMRAVELFDFRRGTRFSTYAYQAIERSIYGLYRTEKRRRAKFTSEGSDNLEQCADDDLPSNQAILEAVEAKASVVSLLDDLEARDREIVLARFGINRPEDGVAFHIIAKRINLSTTRTVQLFNRTMKRMRDYLAE
ncbi:RNA polymerase principal sigma factor HrdB [Rubripirellula obstinata]|uniref:RNA polymerase principal sigma factor HrdB n=2 Tax=Rubripirellula obstinata TaxID=406547 RepID=A0A5B1CHB8_9BACT|nr:RNA polymerase principal sigma factor HrdB [Rubripirellula obstinata]